MVVSPHHSIRTTLFDSQFNTRDGALQSQPQSPPSSPSPSSRISPAVLFIIVILAVIFFISSLLHLLVRFLIRKRPSHRSSGHPGADDNGSADALQRQLQQLFHLHDSGLDQAFIDALPVFLYRELAGPKEPFDCPVCLCEFVAEDSLRLLPVCGHAFHINCIDTWLLSNSTCPLCRGSLFVPGLTIENPVFNFDGPEDEGPSDGFPKSEEKRVFPVRLGKFKNLSNQSGAVEVGEAGGRSICNARSEIEESSSSNLDARRCFSMGSYQYIVADASLQVELPSCGRKSGDCKGARGRMLRGNLIADEEGKRLGIASRGESLSVSKIWLWSDKKGKFPIVSDPSSLEGGLPWMRERRDVGDT